MKINTEPVRGTKDFLPKEMIMRDNVKQIILDTYKKNGFMHIKTPILEDISLLGGSDSGDNTKLMFKVLKRGEKLNLNVENLKENDLVDMGLRYDLTVPLARFYACHSNELTMPFKSIQIDDAFRAERPQKGRLRQFTQCDIDILGDSTNRAEIEVISVAGETLRNLGFENFRFKVNDRRILNSIIVFCGFDESECQKVCITLDKLDKIGYEGIEKELIQNGYENEKIEKLVLSLKQINENGIDKCSEFGANIEDIENLKTIISSVNELADKFEVEFDITIIRGQGYYTSTVLEVYLDGFNGACGGGGRYDNMIEKIVGIKTPAIGFSIGYERVCLIKENEQTNSNGLVLIYDKDDNYIEVLKYANTLKEEYFVTNVLRAKNFNFQLSKLKNNGYDSFVIFKHKEIKQI